MTRRKQKASNGSNAADLSLDGQASGKPIESSSKVPDMTMRQPPTPSELKRKRKRAANGDLQMTPELGPIAFDAAPLSPIAGGYVGTRSASSTRRKQSHEPREAGTGPLPPATPGRGRNVTFQTVSAAGPPATGATHQRSSSLPGAAPHPREKLPEPLKGVTVHIIHVKDTLMDGPAPGDVIMQQLRALGQEAGLGCEFNVTNCGDSYWI